MSAPRALRVVERNARVSRHHWFAPLAGVFEPFLFLFSVGVGVGELVDAVEGPGGMTIDYQTFVAPGLLAGSAMNTAVFAAAFDFFAKYKWMQTFDAMLATPLTTRNVINGELLWILGRALLYAVAFVLTMLAMGLVMSAWGVLLVPAALLVAFAFAGAGFLAATYFRSWLDWDLAYLVIVPLFLFSASFFPLSAYPDSLAWIVRVTPLYHGVDLARDLSLGTVDETNLVSVAYLAVMGATTLSLATRRLRTVLQP